MKNDIPVIILLCVFTRESLQLVKIQPVVSKKKPQKQNTPTPNQPPLKPLKMMTEFLSLFTLTL